MAVKNELPKLSTESQFYLNPQWIESALKYSEVISAESSVSSIDASTLSGGFMADTYVIKIEYSSDDVGPASIVAKFPSSNASSLAAGREMGAYKREINFYKYLAPKLSMRLPGCYFAEIADDETSFALLLEDLRPAEMLDEQFCSIEKSQASIKELALLHAATWNDLSLKDYDWIPDFSNPEYFKQLEIWAAQGWKILKDTAKDLLSKNSPIVEHLPDNFFSAGEAFLKILPSLPALISKRMGFIHCDYRLANLLYKEGDESIALDWQTFHLGRPGFDTYYFVTQTYEEPTKDNYEEILLKTYYEALKEAGVSDYSWDQCVEDYQFGVFYSILMLYVTAHGVGAGPNGIPELLQIKIFRSIPKNLKFLTEHKMLENIL